MIEKRGQTRVFSLHPALDFRWEFLRQSTETTICQKNRSSSGQLVPKSRSEHVQGHAVWWGRWSRQGTPTAEYSRTTRLYVTKRWPLIPAKWSDGPGGRNQRKRPVVGLKSTGTRRLDWAGDVDPHLARNKASLVVLAGAWASEV